MFFKQQADGIIGLQRSHTRSKVISPPSPPHLPCRLARCLACSRRHLPALSTTPPLPPRKVPSVLSSLVRERQSAHIFSLCLSSSSGMLLLGGKLRTAPDPLAPHAGRVLTVPMVTGARAAYTLRVQEMRVAAGQPGCDAGASSGRAAAARCRFHPLSRLPPSAYHPTIVDSGTTFMYTSTPIWRALLDLITKTLPDSFSKVRKCHLWPCPSTQHNTAWHPCTVTMCQR